MDEYIKREAAKKTIENLIDNADDTGDYYCALYKANCEIDRIPAADVVERIHGRWIVKDEEAICSVCSCEALIDPKMIGKDFAIEELSDFCPHCGAEMNLKTGHSEEEWEKAVENIGFLRNEAKQILMGSFYVAQCDRMLREYEQGNRSDELFEEMMNAH